MPERYNYEVVVKGATDSSWNDVAKTIDSSLSALSADHAIKVSRVDFTNKGAVKADWNTFIGKAGLEAKVNAFMTEKAKKKVASDIQSAINTGVKDSLPPKIQSTLRSAVHYGVTEGFSDAKLSVLVKAAINKAVSESNLGGGGLPKNTGDGSSGGSGSAKVTHVSPTPAASAAAEAQVARLNDAMRSNLDEFVLESAKLKTLSVTSPLNPTKPIAIADAAKNYAYGGPVDQVRMAEALKRALEGAFKNGLPGKAQAPTSVESAAFILSQIQANKDDLYRAVRGTGVLESDNSRLSGLRLRRVGETEPTKFFRTKNETPIIQLNSSAEPQEALHEVGHALIGPTSGSLQIPLAEKIKSGVSVPSSKAALSEYVLNELATEQVAALLADKQGSKFDIKRSYYYKLFGKDAGSKVMGADKFLIDEAAKSNGVEDVFGKFDARNSASVSNFFEAVKTAGAKLSAFSAKIPSGSIDELFNGTVGEQLKGLGYTAKGFKAAAGSSRAKVSGGVLKSWSDQSIVNADAISSATAGVSQQAAEQGSEGSQGITKTPIGYAFKRMASYAVASGALYQAINAFYRFYEAFKQVDEAARSLNKTLQLNQQELNTTKASLMDIAQANGQTAATTFKIAEQWGKQGKRGSALNALTSQSAALVNVSGMEPDSAVSKVTAAQKQYALSLKQTIQLQDKWVRLSQTQRVEVSDLASGFAQVGALAKNSGFSVNQLNAALAATTATSEETGDNVANAFRSIFSRVNSPNTQTTTAFAAIGLNLQDYVGNTPKLLEDLAKKWDKLTAAEKQNIAIAAAEKRRAAVFMSLMQTMTNGDYSKALSAQNNASGALAKANAERMKALDKQIQSLQTAFAKWANQMAQGGLIQTLTALAGASAKLLNAWSNAPGVVRTVLNLVAAFAALKGAAKVAGMIGAYGAVKNTGIGGSGMISDLMDWLMGATGTTAANTPKAVAKGSRLSPEEAALQRARRRTENAAADANLPSEVREAEQIAKLHKRGSVVAAQSAVMGRSGAVLGEIAQNNQEVSNYLAAAKLTVAQGTTINAATLALENRIKSGEAMLVAKSGPEGVDSAVTNIKLRAKNLDNNKIAKELLHTGDTEHDKTIDQAADLESDPSSWQKAYHPKKPKKPKTAKIAEDATGEIAQQAAVQGTEEALDKTAAKGAKNWWTSIVQRLDRSTIKALARQQYYGGKEVLGGAPGKGKITGIMLSSWAESAGLSGLEHGSAAEVKALGTPKVTVAALKQKGGAALESIINAAGGLAGGVKPLWTALKNNVKAQFGAVLAFAAENPILVGVTLVAAAATTFYLSARAAQKRAIAAAKKLDASFKEYEKLIGSGKNPSTDQNTAKLALSIAKQAPEAIDLKHSDLSTGKIAFDKKKMQQHYDAATSNNWATGDWKFGLFGNEWRNPLTGNAYWAAYLSPRDKAQFAKRQAASSSQGALKAGAALFSGMAGSGAEGYMATAFSEGNLSRLSEKSMEKNFLLNKEQKKVLNSALYNNKSATFKDITSNATVAAVASEARDYVKSGAMTWKQAADWAASTLKKASESLAKAVKLSANTINYASAVQQGRTAFDKEMQHYSNFSGADFSKTHNLAGAGMAFNMQAVSEDRTYQHLQRSQGDINGMLSGIKTDLGSNLFTRLTVLSKKRALSASDVNGGDLERLAQAIASKGPALAQSLADAGNEVLQQLEDLTTRAQQAAQLNTQNILYGGGNATNVMMYNTFGTSLGAGYARGTQSGYKSAFTDNVKKYNKLMKQGRSEEAISYYQEAMSNFQNYSNIEDAVKQAQDQKKQERLSALQREKDLWNTWFSALQEYLSYLQETKQSTTEQAYLLTKKLRSMAKSPQEKLQLDQQLYTLKQQVYSERISGAEGWLSHETALDAISIPSQIKVWQKVYDLAKKTDNNDAMWQAEEQIYALKKQQAEKAANELAKGIFKRAAGASGPLAISIGEYRAAMEQQSSASDSDIKDSKGIMKNFTEYMQKNFGGMSTNIRGKITPLWNRMKQYADSVRDAAAAQNPLNSSTKKLTSSESAMKKTLDLLSPAVNTANGQLTTTINTISTLASVFGTMTTSVKSVVGYYKDLSKLSNNIVSPEGKSKFARLEFQDKSGVKVSNTAYWNDYHGWTRKAVYEALKDWGNGGGGGGAPVSAGSLNMPVRGGKIISEWGAPRKGHKHQGVDIQGKYGAPIYSFTSGVANPHTAGLGGNAVTVADDTGATYYYAHMRNWAVKKGERVNAGQLIGYVGTSGDAKGGVPHVHFQYAPHGGSGYVNPYDFIMSHQDSGNSLLKTAGSKEKWSTSVASWYGPGLYGRKMADGEILTPNSMIVAHKTMPFGTKLKFMYNGRTAIATVADRGPYVAGRYFDLGPGTAKALHFDGVHSVSYQHVYHSGGIVGDEVPAIVKRGELIVNQQNTPKLLNIMTSLDKMAGGNSAQPINFEINLTLPDGSTKTVKATKVVGIPGDRVKFEAAI